jgi:two-component system, OmpR family, phosphate regulon response regulator PhoB
VLIADDSEALRLVMRITVESQGWSVLEAPTGYDALALAAAERPDLVLLDLNFGDDLDGIEVCRQLRAQSATAQLPVVVLTASELLEDRDAALAAGANEFLTKPFGPLDLLEIMRRMLGQYLSGAGLGLYLVDAGAITPAQLQRALVRQRQRAGGGDTIQLGALLVEHGFISELDLDRALARQRSELGLAPS